jgi:predicted GIY-YIG superfamily endonuclease
MYTLYILHSETLDRYYVGYTNNIARRLEEHIRKKGKYTDAGIQLKSAYSGLLRKVVCQPTETEVKSAPLRIIAPVL